MSASLSGYRFRQCGIETEKKMICRERLLRQFSELVAIDTESFHEGAMRDYMKRTLSELGLEVLEDDAPLKLKEYGEEAGNLYVRIPGTCPGKPLLFSSHLDTVKPGKGKKAIFQEDGRICSDGTTVLGADDAAGIASILEAVRVILERDLPHPDIELLFPVAEELYGKGSSVFDYSHIRAGDAYVLDLTGRIGTAALRAPTILSLDIVVKGKAAHAGFAPEEGINALSAAAAALQEIRTGHVSEETTVNFGMISGGKGRNIVPEEIRISGEVRSLIHADALRRSEEILHVFREKAGKVGASAEMTVREEVHAFSTDTDAYTVKRLQKAVQELWDRETELVSTFGGSDQNNFALHGIEGIVLANAMNEVHSVREYTETEELVHCAELTLELMTMKETT